MERYIIGITGLSGSGKSSISNKFLEKFRGQSIIISQDSFYKSTPMDVNFDDYNLDVPAAIDFELFENILKDIKSGIEVVNIPIYDFKLHKRIGYREVNIKDTKIFIIDGIFIYYYQHIRQLFDIKFYIDTDPDVCLLRRIKRDISERGDTVEMVLDRYERFVKPSYVKYIHPVKKYANIIIPFGSDNYKYLDLFSDL